MKKYILFFIVAILMVGSLSACNSASASGVRKDDRIVIVTTIFPEYDWVSNVLGENPANVELINLLNNGVDLHSYQPTAADILKIKTCDMFVYVGGESDEWVEDVLSEASNENVVVINLLEALGDSVKEEEIVEGMQHDHDHDHGHEDADEDHDHDHGHEDADEDHDHDHGHEDADADHDHDHEDADADHDHDHEDADADHDHDHEDADADHDHDHEDADDDHDHDHEDADADHDHDHEDADADHDHDHEHHHEDGEVEYDEHVWLSLRNASVLVEKIAEGVAKLDPANASAYQKNADSYQEKLAELDTKYQEAVSGARVKTVLFGDRFPFRYLVDDYGLDYYAAFVGCSAETEASFETIRFLADKTDELGLTAIMTIEGKDHRIAETIRDNTSSKNQEILTLDSLQSTTSKDVEAGMTYLKAMTDNLEVLKRALQ